MHLLILAILGATLPAALAIGATTAGSAGAGTPSPETTPHASFRATGNEPSWRLDIGATEMTLLTNFGQTRLVVPRPAPQVRGTTTTYAGRADQGEILATITDRLCVDSMSGMPHPQSVTVVTAGQTLNGCGGEPVSLLQGAEWSVVKINGAPLVAGSRVTLAFAPDGRLAGNASCNRFMSSYTLSGEGLAIAQVTSTRMMCDKALMDQERAFVAALGKVHGFSIAADGALVLRTGDGGAIQARR